MSLQINQARVAEFLISYSFEAQKADARFLQVGASISPYGRVCFNRGFREESIADIESWSRFVENLHKKAGTALKPFRPVDILMTRYLKQTGSVLDVGCETGKNALCLAQAGHTVTLIDVAPNAIKYTLENLHQKGLVHRVNTSIVGKIENLDVRHGPFKAVVGTYAFSFIPPELFREVMSENILRRIEPGGYFAGGFFGSEHAWAKNPQISSFTLDTLKEVFLSMRFSLCQVKEKKEKVGTVFKGQQFFHTLEVIAQRNPN